MRIVGRKKNKKKEKSFKSVIRKAGMDIQTLVLLIAISAIGVIILFNVFKSGATNINKNVSTTGSTLTENTNGVNTELDTTPSGG